MNEGTDEHVPDQIPEDPQNDISDCSEDQRACFRKQDQSLPPYQIHTSWSPQLSTESSLNITHASVKDSPALSFGPGNSALLHYYESQMRDHAAAYASAAAAAAMTAAQIAENIASTNDAYHEYQQQPYGQHTIMPMPPMTFPESPQTYQPSNSIHQNIRPFYQHQSLIHASSQAAHGNDNNPHHMQGSSESWDCISNTNYHRRRRKRQQHVSSSNLHHSGNQINNSKLLNQSDLCHRSSNREHLFHNSGCTSVGNSTGSIANRLQQGQQKRGRRRRRFWNEAGSSDSGDPSYNYCNNNSDNKNCHRNKKIAKAASSSSDGGSTSWVTKKKPRQPNDDSLLGKTGVSALYEWCMKRRTTPTFSMTQTINDKNKKDTVDSENETQHDEPKEYIETQQHIPEGEEGKRRRLELEHDFFETIVSIDGVRMGSGRGRTKTSAKHEASRRALLTLLPGVEFDEDSGILVRLPGINSRGTSHGRIYQKIAATTSLEDLAPNLAKQLAIGQRKDDEKIDRGKQRGRNSGELSARDSRKRQKWPHVYPGTSTTSDDEDENSYYTSRGAYVCSSLLHAMVQIDERLTEAPEFTYQVSAITNEAVGCHPKLKRKAEVPIDATSTAIPRGSFKCTGTLKLQINLDFPRQGCGGSFNGKPQKKAEPRECYRLLRSSGVGGTKREARHTAAAKLLAMLFPECEGMADVKQAAEGAREKYAASRALKQQSKREAQFTGSSQSNSCLSPIQSNDNGTLDLMFGSIQIDTPQFPAIIKHNFLQVLGELSSKRSCQEKFSRCQNQVKGTRTLMETGLVRQLSRQEQLEERIDRALQKLNERDDEGRSLPGELTADDVGRTVLRRARSNDVFWVEKLFSTKSARICACDLGSSYETILVTDKDPSSLSMRLWSSSTIVLLLCRAIVPHEEPPLGCAVLTVGFSWKSGKVLRIAQIASKSHQPRERFIETLSAFAKNMECSLITTPSRPSLVAFETDCIKRLIDPLFGSKEKRLQHNKNHQSKTIPKNVDLPATHKNGLGKLSLQAVEEEGEVIEESDSSSHKYKKEKRREKPSKRSRFE